MRSVNIVYKLLKITPPQTGKIRIFVSINIKFGDKISLI